MSKKFLLIALMLIVFSVGFCGFEVQDDFEDGDASGWSDNGNCDNGGGISVDSDAKLSGNYGLNISKPSGDCIFWKSISGSDYEYSVWFNQPYSFAGFQDMNLRLGGVPKIMMRQYGSSFICYSRYNGNTAWNPVTLTGCGSHPSVDTWYRFKIEYVSGETTASCFVYDIDNNLLCSSEDQTVDSFTPNSHGFQIGDDGVSVTHWDAFGYQFHNATESEGDVAIEQGIWNSVLKYNYTIHSDKQLYIYNGTDHSLGTFDKVVRSNNQVWAFNYVTENETYTSMVDESTSIYIWENSNMSTSDITESVKSLINSTKLD